MCVAVDKRNITCILDACLLLLPHSLFLLMLVKLLLSLRGLQCEGIRF